MAVVPLEGMFRLNGACVHAPFKDNTRTCWMDKRGSFTNDGLLSVSSPTVSEAAPG